MRSEVGGGTLEGSRDWLATDSRRYLADLRNSEPHKEAARLLTEIVDKDGAYDAVFIGTGAAGQRFGRIDDIAQQVTDDAGSVDFITVVNTDI